MDKVKKKKKAKNPYAGRKLPVPKFANKACVFCEEESDFLKKYGFCKCKNQAYINMFKFKHKKMPDFRSASYLFFCNAKYAWLRSGQRVATKITEKRRKEQLLRQASADTKPKTILRKGGAIKN